MKRKFRTILSITLCLMMILGNVAVGGEGFAEVLEAFSIKASAAETLTSGSCGNNVNYSFDSSTGTLTISGTGAMTNYNSPWDAPWGSSRSSIKNVVINSGVTSIGRYAFYECTGLTSITIGNSVTSIGDDAFKYCTGLTSITIGNSVTSIGDYAFKYCTGLTNITIPNSVTSIGDYAFEYCTGLTSITIPNSVTSIGNGAFYNTGYYNNDSKLVR